jgi:glycoprotein-N-acetylgalactosamine 3-beta-galactosyltransferase
MCIIAVKEVHMCIFREGHVLAFGACQVGRIDPYLLRRQYVSGELPSLAIDPKECKRFIRSAYRKAAFDKITVPHLSRNLSTARRSNSRVLCMVVTTSNKHDSDLHDVRTTWGKNCDGFIAFSNATNLDVSAIQTPVAGGDSYENLGEKTRAMFKYAWYHFGHQFDWFFKADDDTFVIMENLIQYLRSEEIQREREAGKGVYLGHRMQIPNFNFVYTSGGGGYLLDRIAVRELVHNLEKLSCQSATEDLQVGQCLLQSGITVYNTTDANDEEMFHPFNPSLSVNPNAVRSEDWYIEYRRPMGVKLGLEAVSVNTTTFHYMRGGAQAKAYKYLKYCKTEKESGPSQERNRWFRFPWAG